MPDILRFASLRENMLSPATIKEMRELAARIRSGCNEDDAEQAFGCLEAIADLCERGKLGVTIDAWAASHEREHGHPPLIIGREYTYVREPFTLIGANEDDEQVVVRSGGFEVTTCHKTELRWIKNLS